MLRQQTSWPADCMIWGLFPLEFPPAFTIRHPLPIVDFESASNMLTAGRVANERIKKCANVRARARQPDGQMSWKAPATKAGSAHGNNFMGGAQTKRGTLTEPPLAREMQRRPDKPRQVLRKLKGQCASGVFKEDYTINCLRTTHDRKTLPGNQIWTVEKPPRWPSRKIPGEQNLPLTGTPSRRYY